MTTRPRHSFPQQTGACETASTDVGLSLLVIGLMLALLTLILAGTQALPDSAAGGPGGGPALQSSASPVAPGFGAPPAQIATRPASPSTPR